jgi:hypothetical protein
MYRIRLLSPDFLSSLSGHATSVRCNLDHCGRDCFWLEQAFQRLDVADVHKYNSLVRQPCEVKGAHGALRVSTFQHFNDFYCSDPAFSVILKDYATTLL